MKRVAEAVPYTRYACLELSFRETNRNDGRAVFYARPCKIAVWIPTEQISYHFPVFSEYPIRGTVKFINTKRRFVVNYQAVRLNYDERHKTNLTKRLSNYQRRRNVKITLLWGTRRYPTFSVSRNLFYNRQTN